MKMHIGGLCGYKFSVYLVNYQGVYLLEYMVRMFSFVKKKKNTTKWPSQMAVLFCIPTRNKGEFLLLHIFVGSCHSQFRILDILLNTWQHLLLADNFIMTEFGELLFTWLPALWVSTWAWCLFLYPLLNQMVCLLIDKLEVFFACFV